jgi:hypothetical protein
MGAAPPAWEQRRHLITLFTTHPGMGGEKVATIHTRGALFFNRHALDSQNDIRHAQDSWGSALSIPQTTPVATTRLGLDHRWSTKE